MQQANDHELNTADQRHHFIWRLAGTLTGGLLTSSTIALGAWLVAHDASATGVSMMIAAAAGLVGTAIYGQRSLSAQTPPEEKPSGNDD